MYNWRLLILAVFAVCQPIASFTERNLVDGRQQCCDHRLSGDSSYSLYGENRFKTEDRRLNDQRREIREVRRDERRTEGVRESAPAINTFRDYYREREIRQSPEWRARESRTQLYRQGESERKILNGVIKSERARTFRITSTVTDHIRNSENHRENRFRATRPDETRVLRSRNADNLDQLNLERRTIDSRRETRYMRDNVDEVRRNRDNRDMREELRRTRNNDIRTDRLRTLDTQRVPQDKSQDRRASASRFVLRDQRTVRALDRLSRASNDNRRLSFENLRVAHRERENRDARTREEDETRREHAKPVIVRSTDRDVGSRFSATRSAVFRNQRSGRSLDRHSTTSGAERRPSFENTRITNEERDNAALRAQVRDERRNSRIDVRARQNVEKKFNTRSTTQQLVGLRNDRSQSLGRLSRGTNDERRHSRTATEERENREMLARDRVEGRNKPERRNHEHRFRERSSVDREFDPRISAARKRTQRNVRSLDRLSIRSNDYTRRTFENTRISEQQRLNRDSARDARVLRARERIDVNGEAARRYIEIRSRERSLVDRDISRNTMSREINNNLERRSSVESSRRNNELRSTFGDRAYQLNRERNNDDSYRVRRVSREHNDLNRRSVDSRIEVRLRMDSARERTGERITLVRNIHEDSRDNIRVHIRDASLKDRRVREINGRRLSRAEYRLVENSRTYQSVNSGVREGDDYSRAFENRIGESQRNHQLRDTTKSYELRENVPRTQIRNREINRDEHRISRSRTVKRRSMQIQERISSERDTRVHRRYTETRYSSRDGENLIGASSESRIERQIPLTRDNVHADRRNSRDVERNVSIRNMVSSTETSRMKSNSFSRNNINAFSKGVENDEAYDNSWKNLIYTMQGIYLCSIFIPMLMKNSDKKKQNLSTGMWTPFRNLIKIG